MSDTPVTAAKQIRCALYLRVSTPEQHLTQQEKDVRRAVRARGWKVAKVYKEKASGADANRPQWRALQRDAQQRKFAAVAVWNVDRMGRDILETHKAVAAFRARKIRLYITELNFDVDGLMGDVLIGVLAALARAERENIRIRTRAGIRRAREAGGNHGRPRARLPAARLRQVKNGKLTAAELAREVGCSAKTVLRHAAAL